MEDDGSENGFSEADIGEIFDQIKCIHFSENGEGIRYSGNDIGVSIAFAITQQLYSNTWVSVEGVPGCISATEGSCAGMPLADIIYSVAMSRVLNRIRSQLLKVEGNLSGELQQIRIKGTTHQLCEVSFYDDSAFSFLSEADRITDVTRDVVSVIIDVFRMFYLDVNMKKNKTEAIISAYGPGSKRSKRLH